MSLTEYATIAAMRKENPPPEVQHNVPLGEFLKGGTEEWIRKWQDRNFTYSFPSRVQMFLSDDRHDQFLKEHGNTIIASSVSAFMQLPWGPRDKNSIAVSHIAFTKERKTVTFLDNKILTSGNAQVADSLIKAEIASLLLLGFNPANQEATVQSLTSGSGELTTSRKITFRHNVFRLITNNSSLRAWIKAYNLDAKNGFVWDRDVTKLALSLAPPGYKNPTETLRVLPNELLNLEQFPVGVIEVFVDYVLNYARSLSKIDPKRRDITLFIVGVERHPDGLRYEEKLSRLKELSRSW